MKTFHLQKEPELEFGAIYNGRITEIKDIGVMVELHPKVSFLLLVANGVID